MVVFQLISVIFIDFDYQGKPGEKSLRSLDAVSYQDGVVSRSRGSLKDSYGNPVEYDTIAAVDAKLPGKNHKDPNQFIIPGYASGILKAHELPVAESRKIEDDRVHFVDPFRNTNTFQNSDKPIQAPLSTLFPPGSVFGSVNTQVPIEIPRPNIDANETPVAPIDDPLSHQLAPPQNDLSSGLPSLSLEAPSSNKQRPSVALELIPPQIPSDGESVLIPRPNIDASETPIDNSNGPLNQGLLPPASNQADGSNAGTAPTVNPFANTSNDGPVLITEVHFAPKPSNGLLPPKDPSPNDVNFQSPDSPPSPTTPTKFDNQPGVIGQAVNRFTGTLSGAFDQTVNKAKDSTASVSKFTGSFGGAQGVLGTPAAPVNKFTGSFGGAQGVLGTPVRQSEQQIPVVILQSPPPTQISFTSTPSKAATVNKYQGSFGGSPGILVSDKESDRVTFPQAQPTIQVPSVAPTAPTSTTAHLDNRFSGSFGGASGVLGDSKPANFNNVQPTQALPTLPTLSDNLPEPTKSINYQKYTGQFGGAPGVLRPYDNSN